MRKRDYVILALAGVVAVVLGFAIFASTALETGSWGLSFREEGSPPIGTAARDQLRELDAAYLGDPSEKVLYLTFDAGYENGATGKILDVLQAQNVPAAFFLTGHYIEKNADLVRRMGTEGHTVASHTMTHPDLSKLESKEALAKELSDLEALYTEKTGQTLSKFLRPPQGLYSENSLGWTKELGYKTVFWSLAHVDWNNDAQPTREQALNKLLPRTHNGAVVLLHATSHGNADVLEELITNWKDMGYTFGTLEELFA